MSEAQIPSQFEGAVDLAAELLGGFVLHATDDYFAEKENLLHPQAPVFIEGKYTDRGKWMDGWESQRRRTPGHDWATVRLGVPGRVRGVLVDTTHFRGNAPSEIQLEGIDTESVDAALGEAGYRVLIPRTKVKPHSNENLFTVSDLGRVSHVRLRIYPDGGVARLRVWGDVLPAEATFLRPGSIDLVAVENGGTVVKVSDRFFGPPSNLLLPGRGVNMGDGWETARRRTPGTDWAVLKLGRRGTIERIELDTHFFKGNAPQAVTMEALDAQGLAPAQLDAALGALTMGGAPWRMLLATSPLAQHKRHVLQPDFSIPLTHVRVHIHPHGGVNRLRLFGVAADSEAVAARVASLREGELQSWALGMCGSQRWASALAAQRPFASARALLAAADAAFAALADADWLEAFAAHPRIGAKTQAGSADAFMKASHSEQGAAVASAPVQVTARLAELNEQYLSKYGFIYIVFAAGKSAEQMLELLELRLGRSRDEELRAAAAEQVKITRLRLERWLLGA